MTEPELLQDEMITLNIYRAIYYTRKYGDRAQEFDRKDERIIELIYNRWRNLQGEVILDCDDCVEEAFDRLMKQMLIQQGYRKEFNITDTKQLKAHLLPRVKGKMEREN